MADMVKKVKVFRSSCMVKREKWKQEKRDQHLNIEERRQIAILDKEGWFSLCNWEKAKKGK